MPKLSSDSDDDHEGPHEDNVEEVASAREVVKDEPKVNGDAVKTQPCDRQLRDWHDGLCSCHKDVGNCEFLTERFDFFLILTAR